MKKEKGRMKLKTTLLGLIGLLVLLSLACAQAGEVVTPEEATRRAEEERNQVFSTDSIEAADFDAGDTAILTGRSFLVNLLNEPGGRISGGQERGAEVSILELVTYEDEVWYHIDAPTGDGWVKAANLEPLPDGEGDTADEASGPQPGDTVYLTGVSFLVNLLREPGGFIAAGQERGTAVTIVDSVQFEGDTWYLVNAPTGEGWVPSENITTEEPE